MKPSYNEFNIMNSQDQMGVYDEMEKKAGSMPPTSTAPLTAVSMATCTSS